MKAAQPGPGGNSSIKRLEARGGVIVTQKDQTATGETGIFDMKTNTITLAGKVTVTQGQNVLRGDRLVVDMTTGAARVEFGGGRVEGLFVPSSAESRVPARTRKRMPARTKTPRARTPPRIKIKKVTPLPLVRRPPPPAPQPHEMPAQRPSVRSRSLRAAFISSFDGEPAIESRLASDYHPTHRP